MIEWEITVTINVTEILVEDFRNHENGKSEDTDNEYRYVCKYRWLPLRSDTYTPFRRSDEAATPYTGVQNPTRMGM